MSGLFTNSSSQWLNMGSMSDLQNVSGATLCCWLTDNGGGGTENQAVYLSNGSATTSARANIGVRLGSAYRSSGRRLDADSVSIADSSTSPSSAVHHMAAVFRYSTQGLDTYIDGVLQTSTFVAGWTGNTSNTASLGGALAARADGANFHDGLISDARIYNRALSAGEIANLFRCRGRDNNVQGLVQKWKMQGGSPGAIFGAPPNSVSSLSGTPTGTPFILFDNYIAVNRRRRRR